MAIMLNLSCCITHIGASAGGLSRCIIAGGVVAKSQILFLDTICLNILHYLSLNVCSGSMITKFM